MADATKFILAVLVVVSLHTSAFGQRRGRAQGNKGTTTRRQTVSLPFPPPRDYEHKRPVSSRYDRFEDKTTVAVETEFSTAIDLRASFSYSGQKLLSPPSAVVLIFTEISSPRIGVLPGGGFIRNREAIFLIEGRAVRAAGVYRRGGVNENGWREEYLGIEMPLRTFLELVNARSVSARVAGFEVDFSDEQMEALRDLASRMNPKANVDAAESTASQPTQPTLETKEHDAEAVSSHLESLAAQSQSTALSVSPLVGRWIFETSMPDEKKVTLSVTFRVVNGSYKCLNFQTGQVIEFRDCAITGNSFTFKFQSTARDGRAWNFTYTGSVQDNKAVGKVIADDGNVRPTTLPLTGTRID